MPPSPSYSAVPANTPVIELYQRHTRDLYKTLPDSRPNIYSEDDFHTSCQNVSHNPQLSPSQDYTNLDHQPTTNIDSPGSQPTTVFLRTTQIRTINQPQTLTLMMTSTQVVETSVTNNNNSLSQDYTNPDHQPTTNINCPRYSETEQNPCQIHGLHAECRQRKLSWPVWRVRPRSYRHRQDPNWSCRYRCVVAADSTTTPPRRP